jgi:hypothetical protein
MPKPKHLVLLILFTICPATAADFTIDTLLNQFAQTPRADAQFEETRQIALLESPLHLSGTLTYRSPDYLKKQVLTPNPSLLEITGDNLNIESETDIQSLPLDSHPLLRAVAEAYRAVLSGNGTLLKKHFETELGGTVDNWSLRLLPREEEVRSYINEIVIRGSGGQIRTTLTVEVSGDTSLMTISPTSD